MDVKQFYDQGRQYRARVRNRGYDVDWNDECILLSTKLANRTLHPQVAQISTLRAASSVFLNSLVPLLKSNTVEPRL